MDSMDRWIDKENVDYIEKKYYSASKKKKKEENPGIFDNMAEPGRYYAQWISQTEKDK